MTARQALSIALIAALGAAVAAPVPCDKAYRVARPHEGVPWGLFDPKTGKRVPFCEADAVPVRIIKRMVSDAKDRELEIVELKRRLKRAEALLDAEKNLRDLEASHLRLCREQVVKVAEASSPSVASYIWPSIAGFGVGLGVCGLVK